MRLVAAALSVTLAAAPILAQPVDRSAINRIIDQGTNHSEVMETAAYLTDRIGGRLTNSPQMREAERWTQQRFRDWGLSNVRAEGFEFGRGWSIVSSSARMTAPRPLTLTAIPIAWTPPTNGTISAGIIVAPLSETEDFAEWRGKLRGKIVLITRPDSGSEPSEAPFRRLSDEDLRERNEFRQPTYSPAEVARNLERASFEAERDAFLAEEGALAWVRMARRDGRLVHGEGYLYQVGATPRLPAIEMAAEDYRRLARLALTDAPPTLEITNDVRFNDEDVNSYNIFAEIPGTDRNAGYVMAGAHLDSWVAADGAQDNGAGTAVVMEAARILARLGVRPKRTIRFALWNGEEQGLLGSLAYTERYLATRPPETDPARTRLPDNRTWRYRWPLTPQPGHRDLVAYFNLDNGSGKIRGIHAEGNVAAVPIFQDWLAPFASMGATTVGIRATGGTDHVYMQAVGVPGYQFIQDPLDYGSRIHHTSLDSYDHLKPEDLRQAAIIMASFLLNAANRDEPLPRMPLPTQPRPSDPFEYPEED
ncbi:M20/M25/M40 family metallo-hydrolase [Sphingosinicella sp. LHD-64]|uniref:M20/M25/M40 family metallo-hydrolase n=1 Tax=Sphingosinicella sp. LHD-64 TaxID=3072139 RepID=UPI00281032DE|nr:M20/M25/M40 family metallo-hydrolase [Sphingosinicella sp. LHD-64]MDQ8756281.1 M20/M25/M40 family metallo-hydrolase [Sphingosinicella sp. LHD-64]